MPGQEGVAPVYSPMARTLEDLEYFWKAVMDMEPWKYDHSVGQYVCPISAGGLFYFQCLPIPWRNIDLSKKPLTWGVMWDDG